MRRLIAILLLLTGGRLLYCQQTKEMDISEELTEMILEYAERDDSGGDDKEELVEELMEHFRTLLLSPLNINKATWDDLESLVLLSDFQIEALLDYRKEYGNLLSINELFLIPGLDQRLLKILTQFICVAPSDGHSAITPVSIIKEGKSQLLLRGKRVLEKQRGFDPVTREEFEKKPDCRYIGPPGSLYAQYKYQLSDRIRAGVTLEKDPGERGADYGSFNVSLSRMGVLERLVIGDYVARFGQGLILWNSFFMKSVTDPKSLRRSETGITPYNSTDENLSFRGMAATMERRGLRMTLFGSHRTYDARVADSGYTSLLKTGLHNTTTTLKRKGSLKGSLLGTNITCSGSNFKISGNGIVYRYNLPYGGRDIARHSAELMSGGYGVNAGADFYLIMGRLRFFGEAAIDRSLSSAGLAGLLFSAGSKLEMSMQIREHSEKYYSPFANPGRGIRASASYLHGKYRKSAFGLEVRRGYHNLSLISNFDKGKQGVNYYFKLSQVQNRTSLRYSINYPVIHSLRFTNRADFSFAKKSKSYIGTHIFHEAVYKSDSRKIDASLRIAAFCAPVWDVRIYAYERDVLYGFSTPVFYGKGIRWYFNIHYSPFGSLDLWFKISQTRYLDRDIIGEGPDMIEGPSKSEAKLQIRWRF